MPVGTGLLSRDALGPYVVEDDRRDRLGWVVARPDDGHGPTIAAVHAVPPLPRSYGMPAWRSDVRAASSLCGEVDIVAGDLNATLDHPPLQLPAGCVDAAATTGEGHLGTWPAALPRLLGSPIDHILIARRWRALRTRVIDVPESDHRALVTELVRDRSEVAAAP